VGVRQKYGMCYVGVHKTDVVQAIYGALQYQFGFENKNWLR
jgi:hypothetical protein